MRIHLERKWKKDTYTVGRLFINGKYICDTLEDKDRNLFQGQSEEYIREHKVYGETAIPSGRYEVTLDIYSPSFGRRKYYRNFCQGFLPRLLNVPCFQGILIHRGVNAKNTDGCILVGYNTVKGGLSDSQKAFELVYHILESAQRKGEKIWIYID